MTSAATKAVKLPAFGPFLESVYARYHTADYLGSDPLVMVRYPAAGQGMEDWIVRLDVDPT